ncbi:hypothetical protein V8E36_000277 [Tilletia maclaganii]
MASISATASTSGAAAEPQRRVSRPRTANSLNQRPISQSPLAPSFKHARAGAPSQQRSAQDEEVEIIVNVRIHERSYSDQEVIISPECIGRLLAFSYESDLVEFTPVADDAGTQNNASSTPNNIQNNSLSAGNLEVTDYTNDPHSPRRNRSIRDRRGRGKPRPGHFLDPDGTKTSSASTPKYLLFKVKPDLKPDSVNQVQGLTISVDSSIANVFGLKGLPRAVIRKVSSHLETLDHIELTFREQYVGRAEMWRLAMSLEDRCLYVGQKISFAGIVKATVTRLWINERRVHCGYVSVSTKPIFRSESAKINLFIQLAQEMWEFDEDGELYYEKCLTGFIPALLRRWRNAETNHVISVILFARVFYDAGEVELLRRRHENDATHALPIREDSQGRYYADYFKVVLDVESNPDWSAVMETLKEEFFRFQHDILLLRADPSAANAPEPEKSRTFQQTPLFKSGYQDSRALQLVLREQVALAGSLSYSYDGCILEAINLTLNPFDEHYIDRDLTRTGLSLIFVTAGTGHFEVDKKMLRVTTERMIECGIGLDLVCLTKMPLHSVPLFKFASELPDLVDVHYQERWDQAGAFPRAPGGRGQRPSMPTTFAHPQQWVPVAPHSAQTPGPDPLYFDSARTSALPSPQLANSSAASTFGHASGTNMTASMMSSPRQGTSASIRTGTTTAPSDRSTTNAGAASSTALTSQQQPIDLIPPQIEFYSMPHWIDCSFYNLQMDKPFRADRFVPRCKMFEVQMMGIMENELADIAIPYLDERAPVKLAHSMPGTPGVGGLLHLARGGTGFGGGGSGAPAGLMSPYGLGPGFGSFGMGSQSTAMGGATLTQHGFATHTNQGLGELMRGSTRANSTRSIMSASGVMYSDSRGDGGRGNEIERRERAERQMARDQFDEELFKPAEPAHVTGLRNIHGQVGLYGTGGDHDEQRDGNVAFPVAGGPGGANDPRQFQQSPDKQCQASHHRGPSPTRTASCLSARTNTDASSSFSPEKDPAAASRSQKRKQREHNAGSQRGLEGPSAFGAVGSSRSRMAPNASPRGTPGRPNDRQHGTNPIFDSQDTHYLSFRLPMTRTMSQTDSIRSTSTAPTIGRSRGQLLGTIEWIGRAMPAEPVTDSAAQMLLQSGVLDEDADHSADSAAPSSPSVSAKLLPPSASNSTESSPRARSRPMSAASSTTEKARIAEIEHRQTVSNFLRRGLSWFGGQQPATASTSSTVSAQMTTAMADPATQSLEAKLESGSDAYQALHDRLLAIRASSMGVSSSRGSSRERAVLLGASSTVGGATKSGLSRPSILASHAIATDPEVPQVANLRQIPLKQAKAPRTNAAMATSFTSNPIAIGPQSVQSRNSPDLIRGQSQREAWEKNDREMERVRQIALESERARQQIAAQARIEKQTLVNPSNPHKNRATFSSQLGRWQHLFPTRTNRHTVKWLSMTSPACLPLTTLYLPVQADLVAHWKESPYTITASTDSMSILTKRSATTAPAVAIVREMASQRLAQGFQFIVPSVGWNNDEHLASMRSYDTRGPRHVVLKHHPSELFQAATLTSGHPILLSLPNEIHQISTDQGMVNVKRYIRDTEYDTSPIEYSCYIWPRNQRSYHTVQASFKYSDSASYDWNYLDSIISGVEEPRFTESLRYWRTRFVLVPSEEPPSEMMAPNGTRLTDEEIRLMGMDRLADLFMKARFRPSQQTGGGGGERGRAKGWDLRFLPTSLDPAASVGDENFMRALEHFVQGRAKERDRDRERERERDAVPSRGKRLTDLTLKEIVEEMWKEDGLKIHDRLWHRMWYSDAFTGAEFVTWLCTKFDDVRSREEAVEWGTKLQDEGLFTNAGKARGFIDGHAFYSVEAQWAGTAPKRWYNRARQYRDTSAGSRKPSSSAAAEHDKPKRRRVQMSHTLYVDLAAGRKSDRFETAILHHDIAHNPANGFNFQIHWLGTTARFVEDTIRNWTATVERYGLRLIEAPVGQIKDISEHNPFQAPMRIKLAVAPPAPSTYAHLLPHHVLAEQYFEYALLREFGFILDQEAASRYPDTIEIVYDSRPPKFDYSQFVHRSGIAFVQVIGGQEGFLWLNNRLFTSHLPANSRAHIQRRPGGGGGAANNEANIQTPTANVTAQAQADAELLRLDLTDACSDAELLNEFYADVISRLQERADFIGKQPAHVVPATPLQEDSAVLESSAISRRRRKTGEILWAR